MLQYVQVCLRVANLFLHCLTWIVPPPPPIMLQRSFQEALKCSRYTERGTPASSLICCGSAWQGWASCSKEYLKKKILENPSKLEMCWVFSAFNWKSSKVMKLSFCSLHVFGSDLILLRIKTGCFWESICPSLLHQSFICLCKKSYPIPSVSVVLQAALLSARCVFLFVQRGGVGNLGVRGGFVLWLCRLCHSHYVVSLL